MESSTGFFACFVAVFKPKWVGKGALMNSGAGPFTWAGVTDEHRYRDTRSL